MNVKRFIDKPILSMVISIAILIVGLIGLLQLPMEQFPEIAPPTIRVSASYTGANASTVQNSVIAPLEEAINGVENMTYMTSSATNNGSATITVYFKQGTDPDMATVNVQNRVTVAQGLLPAEVTRSGISVKKSQSSNLKILALYSPDGRYDRNFLDNYFKINIEPQISRIAGVGDVNILGGTYALRIWLDPVKMANNGLVPSDISVVLAEQNLEAPTGIIGANSYSTFQYALKYRGRLDQEVDYENIVIKAQPSGEILRLGDVATIELGSISYDFIGEVDGQPGSVAIIAQTTGSNANEIIVKIDELVAEISEQLPEGMEIKDIMSIKDFLDASISNVISTLLEAILLVILVVYIFLQSFKSTIIPTIAIIVSLVGTFAFIYLIGFTLNMLTLFALVLVIGTVVDDAIVVVEAVQAKFDSGYKSNYLASISAMKGISSALVTTSIVFMAVFIPVSFTSGTSGTFYTQFGLTMAIAVAISTVNALTLSPALCALIMTPHDVVKDGEKLSFSSKFHIAFERSFNSIIRKYKGITMFFLKRQWLSIILLIVALGSLAYLAFTTKSALVPEEDQGTVFVNVATAPGSSLKESEYVMDQVDSIVNQIPDLLTYSKIIGFSFMGGQGATNGMFIIRLNDWSERPEEHQSAQAISGMLNAKLSQIKGASSISFTPPMIAGYGTSSGFEVYIQDRKGGSIDELYGITMQFISEISKRPEVSRAFTPFNNRYPQYMVEVDAAAAKRNGVSPADVLSTVAGYVGGSYVSNMNKFSKLYRVMVQASPEDYASLESLDKIFVRTASGEMSPVKNYITLTKVYGSESLTRFNMFPSISISGNPADGYSSGQVIAAIEEVAAQVLPTGYGYEFGGMTREESETGSTTTIIFIICIIFVYLILCALYESIFIPLAVIFSVPFGLVGSFLFAKMFGLANDIYMQTGLIMLIGLLAKTAILLTEFASEKRKAGMPIMQAAISAAGARLRPILMTSLTMIFGMLPLVFASGVGANGNISLGVGIVGGMIVGTVALVLFVPVFFVMMQRLQEKLMPERKLEEFDENEINNEQ